MSWTKTVGGGLSIAYIMALTSSIARVYPHLQLLINTKGITNIAAFILILHVKDVSF